MQEHHAALEPRATPTTDRVIVGSGSGHLLWYDLSDEGTLSARMELRLGGCPSFLAVSATRALAVDEQGSLVYPIHYGEREPRLGTPSASGGTGPAYVAFDRSGAFGLVANYQQGGVCVLRFSWEAATGCLELIGLVSTLGSSAGRAPNTASHLELHPSGRALYVSNRGDDSLAVFATDDRGGLTLHQRVATGKKPRHFSVNPRGDRLLVGNLDAASVTSFEVRDHGLQVAPLGLTGGVQQPFFVGFC